LFYVSFPEKITIREREREREREGGASVGIIPLILKSKCPQSGNMPNYINYYVIVIILPVQQEPAEW